MKRKKYLGQNFLNNKNILEEMARAAELSKKDVVFEVGPGLGSLTEILAKYAKKVIAIEKDSDLIPLLQEKFENFKNVKIVERDILNLTPNPSPSQREERKKKEVFSFFGVRSYKIVANIPYYITSRFLKIFLSEIKSKPKLMVLMVQREVAERILAKDKKNSLLSLSVKTYADAELIRRVPRGAFNPPPKVDSVIIKISNISDKWFKKNKIDEKKFFEILRLAFQQKRKMLRRSIGKKVVLPEKFKEKRPEELTLKDWINIV